MRRSFRSYDKVVYPATSAVMKANRDAWARPALSISFSTKKSQNKKIRDNLRNPRMKCLGCERQPTPGFSGFPGASEYENDQDWENSLFKRMVSGHNCNKMSIATTVQAPSLKTSQEACQGSRARNKAPMN